MNRWMGAFLFFLLLSVGIFRQYVFFGRVMVPGNLLVSFYEPWVSYATKVPAKPIGFDTLRSFYPTRTLVVDELKKGKLPLWNPYSFSGNTLLGVYQSAVFHPLSWLFFILPQTDAWSVIVLLTPIIAGIGMFWFLQVMRLSIAASLFGAVTWAFSGIMIVWWQEMFMATYSIISLPYILGAIEKLLHAKKKYFIFLILGLVWSIFSGWFQNTLYVFVFSLVWAVFRVRSFRLLLYIVFGYVLSLFITAIQWLPALEAYSLSARGSVDVSDMFAEFFAPISQLVTFIAPDYFGNPAVHNYYGTVFYHELVIWIGIPAFLFVIYQLTRWKKITGVEKFFSISSLLVLSLGFSLPTSWLILYYLKLPFVSEMTPSRIFFLAACCFSIVASYGFHHWQQTNDQPYMKRAILLVFTAVAVVWMLAFFYEPNYLGHSRIMIRVRNLIMPTVSFLILGSVLFVNKRKKITSVVIFLISLIGVGYVSNKYLSFSERRFVFPDAPIITEIQKQAGLPAGRQGIDRFWSFGDGAIVRNFANQYQLYSPEGYESFNIARYAELVFASHNNGNLALSVQRADVEIYKAKNISEVLDNVYRRRILALTGTKFIAAQHTEQTGLTRIWTDDVYDLFENKEALPRISFYGDYVVENKKENIITLLYDQKFPVDTMLVLEEEPVGFIKTNKKGVVSLVSYEPAEVEIKTSSEDNQLLFLSDNYYPGWKAMVDGRETKIYRADYTFRAVVVPAGNHEVRFVYKPLSVTIGVVVSIAGVAIVLIAFLCRNSFGLNIACQSHIPC